MQENREGIQSRSERIMALLDIQVALPPRSSSVRNSHDMRVLHDLMDVNIILEAIVDRLQQTHTLPPSGVTSDKATKTTPQ